MTWREKLAGERRWNKRAVLIHFYHNTMLLRNSKWSMRQTSKNLKISLGAASEAIRLCKAILDDPSIELCKTREEALQRIKH